MTEALLLSLAREAVLLMVTVALPPLGASMSVGLLMSLFSATTQLQESTLSVVPKLGAALAALVVAGPWISTRLTGFTQHLFWSLASVGE